MAKCLIALGSNLGDRRYYLDEAVRRLLSNDDSRFVARSRPVETHPIGGPKEQGRFLNEVLMIETQRTPESLLAQVQDVEHALGRVRQQWWGARTIDIDILTVDQVTLQTAALQIPHPRMVYRRFVLEPANEIAPGFVHPLTGWTLAQLLDNLNAPLNYLAITGPHAQHARDLATALTDRLKLRLLSDSRSAHLHPGGQALTTWLEFFDHRQELLTQLPRLQHGPFTVGDFWMNEVLAWSRTGLSNSELESFERRWNELASTVVQPKLLFYIVPSKPLRRDSAPIDGASAAGENRQLARFAVELDKMVGNPAPCPIVRLVADAPRNLEESIAAIRSMAGEC